MPNKNISEINRQVTVLQNDTAIIPARDSGGDLAFSLTTLWNRLLIKLENFYISASNLLMGTADSEGKYTATSTVANAISTKATKDVVNAHIADNYVTGDPHLILANKELFRQAIDVPSKEEVTQQISNVKTFRFRGYFTTVDPGSITGIVLRVGDYWYNGTDFLNVVPQTQVNVSVWDGSSWQTQYYDGTTLMNYIYPQDMSTAIHFDTWSDPADMTGWYWFNGWEQLDAIGDGLTIGNNTQGKLEVINGSLTQVKFAYDVISNQFVREFNITAQIDGVTDTFTVNYDLTTVNVSVFLNGLKLIKEEEFLTTSSDIILTTVPVVGDTLIVVLQGFLPTVSDVFGDKITIDTNSKGQLYVLDDAITTAKLADDSVTFDKLANGAVGNTKLVDNSVSTNKIANNAVTNTKIGNASVTTDKLADYNVTTNKLADGAVTNNKIGLQSVTMDKIVFPIGYVYTQYPGQLAPYELGFYGSWSTLDYGGAFFRSEGGNAIGFNGGAQGDAIRNISGTFGEIPRGAPNGNTQDGAFYFWETQTYSAAGGYGFMYVNVAFAASRVVPTANENRPYNYTMRIWKRVA